MSSPRDDRSRLGTTVVLLASLFGLAWYGQAQLIYSLSFFFQMAQVLFPGLAAIRGAP